MKARLFVCALAACVSLTAIATLNAQDTAPAGTAQAPHNTQQILAALTRRLQLTPDQSSKIGAILQSTQQQIQALRSDSSLQAPELRSKVIGVMQNSNQQILPILNDSQRQQYQEWQQKIMQHRAQQQNQ